MKSPESQVLHLPLLRLMVFPAFLAADPDAGDLLTPIFKLLHSAKLLDSSAKVSGDAESQTGRKKRGHKSA